MTFSGLCVRFFACCGVGSKHFSEPGDGTLTLEWFKPVLCNDTDDGDRVNMKCCKGWLDLGSNGRVVNAEKVQPDGLDNFWVDRIKKLHGRIA